MSRIKDDNQITMWWLNHNGINSFLITELVKCKIIEDRGKGLYYVINKKALNNIVNCKCDNFNLNDDISKLEFKVYADKFFNNGREVRRVAYIEHNNLNREKAIELYNIAISNFIKYIKLRETVLKDPTFNGHYELGKTYTKLNHLELAEKEFSTAAQIAIEKQNFRNLGRVKFQLAELYLNEENYYKALIVYNDLLNNKVTYKMNTNEYKDALYKIMLCKSTLFSTSMVKKDNQINIFIENYKPNEVVQTSRLDLEKDEEHAINLLAIAEHLYKNKKIFLADYIFKKAKDIAKKCKDRDCNIKISELQKQKKLYKILR